jgi:hypothetical protein
MGRSARAHFGLIRAHLSSGGFSSLLKFWSECMWDFEIVITAIKIRGLIASTSVFYLGPRGYLNIASWSLPPLEVGSSCVCT